MADYGLKYLCEYRSKMRGRILYRIEIEQADAVAATDDTALRVLPYSDVFSIKWGNADDAENVVVKGSTLTLKVLCTQDLQYLELFTVDPLKYRVSVYAFYPDANDHDAQVLMWRGFLSTSSYKETFARPPYVVTLTATDGLAFLESLPFRTSDGERYSGVKALWTLLSELFTQLPLDLPIEEWTGMTRRPGIDSLPSFVDIHIDCDRLYQAYDNPTWRDVLEVCTQPFNAQIFQARGVIHVRRIASLLLPTRPEGFDPYADVLRTERPQIHELWQNGCDISASAELNLLPPYREIEVDYEDSSVDVDFYDSKRWIGAPKYTIVMSDRIFMRGYSEVFVVGDFPVSNNIEISISFDIVNATQASLSILPFVYTIDSGKMLYWYSSTGEWSTEYNYDIMTVQKQDDLGKITRYSNLDNAKRVTVSRKVTSVPAVSNDLKPGYTRIYLAVRLFDTPLPDSLYCFLTNAKIEVRSLTESAASNAKTIKANRKSTDSLSWSTPYRDGGYSSSAVVSIANVLMDDFGRPYVSWPARTERGTVMDIVAEDVQRLRGDMTHQLYGEMRCGEAVDLNSLFFDRKFTGVLYYVNALEFLAARQVYKAQLRELTAPRRNIQPYIWTVVATLSGAPRLAASLNQSLFITFRENQFLETVSVKVYDTLSEQSRVLPYKGNDIRVRKGLGAVVIQNGDTTDLYAVDNVGEMISHMTSEVSGVLNFDTALYDADRSMWLSYDSTTAPGKTVLTIFNDEMEMLSQETFDVQADDLLLMANGYILVDNSTQSSYWHSYELHTEDTLLAVNDATDPMTSEQWAAKAVSDSLLVRIISDDAFLQVAQRRGIELQADVLATGDYPSNTYIDAISCNNALVAIAGKRDGVPGQMWAFDANSGQMFETRRTLVEGCGVAGGRAYFIEADAQSDTRRLCCISFEETSFTKFIKP